MWYSICSKLVFQANRSDSPIRNPDTFFCFIRNPCFKSFSNSANESSFTVSYLRNSCGLSLGKALKVAKKVNLETSDNPDSILKILKNYGFTKPQIVDLILIRPDVLLAHPRDNLDPKFQFFKQVGFSPLEITHLLFKCNSLISTSLENRIIPCFNLLRTILPTYRDVALAIKNYRYTDIFRKDLDNLVLAKINVLRDAGLSESNIATFVLHGLSVCFSKDKNQFDEIVREILDFGISPSKSLFAYAIPIWASLGKEKLEAKMDIYRSFGWSDDEIRLAIKTQPTCISISEDKLRVQLNYFMNELNCEPAFIAKAPNVLGLSLEKRIIPRLAVIQFLISKGLRKRCMPSFGMLFITKADFTKKYVTKYEGQFPELIKLNQGEVKG